jgi:hypothetical protein
MNKPPRAFALGRMGDQGVALPTPMAIGGAEVVVVGRWPRGGRGMGEGGRGGRRGKGARGGGGMEHGGGCVEGLCEERVARRGRGSRVLRWCGHKKPRAGVLKGSGKGRGDGQREEEEEDVRVWGVRWRGELCEAAWE